MTHSILWRAVWDALAVLGLLWASFVLVALLSSLFVWVGRFVGPAPRISESHRRQLNNRSAQARFLAGLI